MDRIIAKAVLKASIKTQLDNKLVCHAQLAAAAQEEPFGQLIAQLEVTSQTITHHLASTVHQDHIKMF